MIVITGIEVLINSDFLKLFIAFSAMTLLVGRQEEHPACKNSVIRW